VNDAAVVHETALHCHASAISWPAIIAGAFVASALSIALLLLGSSFGLAMVSPWAGHGASAAVLTAHAAIWLVIMQWASSGLGGYLTGRFRTKWIATHDDEVFFRDTAHGLVTWAVATVIAVAFMGAAATSIAGGGAKMVEMNQAMGPDHGSMYFVDTMFRGGKASPEDRDTRMEANRIFLTDIAKDTFPQEDKEYLAHVVAAHAGVSQAEGMSRVDKAITDTKEAADTARKAAATAAIFTFISMLVGAFIACVAAAMGGRHRDTLHVYTL